jgi:hypothetical protein
MPALINGCGTSWFGKSQEKSDGSYIVTEWITLFWLPIFPLNSKRVLEIDENEYKVRKAPIYWMHLLQVYAMYGILFFIFSKLGLSL